MWRPYYEILSESHKEVETRLPKVFVDDRQSYDGPDRRVQLTSKGAGHTESDLVLYLPDDQIIFTGDLVFNECHPYMAHGSISGWLDWLVFLQTLDIKVVVPGHGQNGSKELIAAMIKYINKMQGVAMKMQTDNLTLDNVPEIEIPEEYKEWWFDQFFVPNLRFAYQQLSEL
jgi:glyoxylase-like metal-dependent hydrolase (beta-lactamase superfamily II)